MVRHGLRSLEPVFDLWQLYATYFEMHYIGKVVGLVETVHSSTILGVRVKGGGGIWLMTDCQNFINGKLPETNYGNIRFVMRWSWGIYAPLGGNYQVTIGFRMGVSLTNFHGVPRRIVWATYLNRGAVCDSRQTGSLHFDRAALRATWS